MPFGPVYWGAQATPKPPAEAFKLGGLPPACHPQAGLGAARGRGGQPLAPAAQAGSGAGST
ncbi:hypothetical protein GCM10011378_09920 [Hymenobacter glacieicola]|uniref:Uncharacterized protein n=1 Tax=Hymenobacter glacieicola TaxID=1562124 RepID=A0ABQ1WKY0_9BACT|nr:hypothetical protein GCM10011378_09920 [Hymenobacter glacieicola]